MTDPHQIFKMLRSDNENERFTAANLMYAKFTNGGHLDDWELYKKGTAPKHKNSSLAEAEARMAKASADTAELMRKWEVQKREKAEATADKERKAREKADADNAKLREQLNKAKARAKAAPPAARVDLLSGLLAQDTVDKLSPEQIGEKIQALYGEHGVREHNSAAQVDLVIGQLTEALYRCHVAMFGKRKRNCNAPTVSEFLETYAGKSASWCRRCYKAYTIVTADDWDARCWDGSGGIEGIIKAAADPNRPKVKRVSKVQQRLDELADVVRRKEWDSAERLVDAWDSALS